MQDSMTSIPPAGTGASALDTSETRKRFTRSSIAVAIIVAVFAFITLFPIYWALRTALSTQRDMLADPGSLLPVGFTWASFEQVLGLVSREESIAAGGSGRVFNFWRYLGNTVLVSTVVAVGQILFSSMAAYSFSRLRWKGRDFVFGLFLASMMVPGIVLMIPNYVFIYERGWMNTYQGIIAPALLFSPYAIFFLRQFFLGLNREIEEAALLDGAGFVEIFWRHVIPMTTGPLLTIGIIQFITQWNDYLWPFLVGRNENVRVLTVALSVFRSQTPQGSPDWPGLMAGTTLSVIPVIVIFAFLGRRISASISFTGSKG